jgi:geranylgeranyl transferase type-2 subunit alpha
MPKGTMPNEKEILKKQAKMKAYKKLATVLLAKRNKNDVSLKTLELTAKMVVVNPDFYTIWGYRREILAHHFNDFLPSSGDATTDKSTSGEEQNDLKSKEVTQDALDKMYLKELVLTENALSKRNPKSYYAWHHRKWVLSNGGIKDLEKELLLTEQFLERDERNFHCWNYRRCVLSKLNDLSIIEKCSKEVKFTDKLIQRNFSNYSAWHERSKTLKLSTENIEKELKTVDTAIFTEPDDQTAWIYHRWLITQAIDSFAISDIEYSAKLLNFEFYETFLNRLNCLASPSNINDRKNMEKEEQQEVAEEVESKVNVDAETSEKSLTARVWCINLIDAEIKMCHDLLNVEPTSKWGRLHLIFLYEKKVNLLTNANVVVADNTSSINDMTEKRKELLLDLYKTDPMHSQYYQYLLKQI